jgi:hypothetical protein
MTKTFHRTNYGSFGAMLPSDSEGYVHLTAKGWVAAGYPRRAARQLARRAREEVREADARLERCCPRTARATST